MLAVSERQLRGWERQGLIPAAATYDFSDLIALKSLCLLRRSGVTPRTIGRAVNSIKTRLSDVQHPLSECRITCDGKRIVVYASGQKMEPFSGQLLFDFESPELGRLKSFAPKPLVSKAVLEREAEMWFQRGLELEEIGAPVEQAQEAYEKSVALNPHSAGSLVNLGTIWYKRDKFDKAREYYTRAIQADERYPLAYFNLGNLYDEEGDLEMAERYYMRALEINPGYADAHFNLALIHERNGEAMKAVRHWKSYLRLDSISSWAEIARRQLEKLRRATLVSS